MELPDLIINPYLHIRSLWILSILLLVIMIRKKLRTELKREWNVEYEFDWTYRGTILQTLMQMYALVLNSDALKLAELVREEVCRNSAIAFQKPVSYFVRYRNDYHTMKIYFENPELIKFLTYPRGWAIENGAIKLSFFGLIKEKAINQNYLGNLNRLLDAFIVDTHTNSRDIR